MEIVVGYDLIKCNNTQGVIFKMTKLTSTSGIIGNSPSLRIFYSTCPVQLFNSTFYQLFKTLLMKAQVWTPCMSKSKPFPRYTGWCFR